MTISISVFVFYEQNPGPDFWVIWLFLFFSIVTKIIFVQGLLNPKWSHCNKGRRQSPVDINPDLLLYDPGLAPINVNGDHVSISNFLPLPLSLYPILFSFHPLFICVFDCELFVELTHEKRERKKVLYTIANDAIRNTNSVISSDHLLCFVLCSL